MTTHSRLYRGDASGQPQHKAGRIDISKQVRQARGIAACGFLSGVSLAMASGLGFVAYAQGDATPAALSGVFGSAGLLFGAMAAALAGKLLGYVYNGEIIIESLTCTIAQQRQALSSAKLSLLSTRSALTDWRGSLAGAVPEDTLDATGAHASSSGAVIPFNGKTVRRFPS